MRYYKIVITDIDSGKVYQPPSLAGLNVTDASFTSYVNGQTLSSALNVQLDLMLSTGNAPRQGSFVRIWGVSLQELAQSANLGLTTDGNGASKLTKNITIFGGMAKGLPLANPAQQGPILVGAIQQAFGNWSGTDMALDLIVTAPLGDPAQPKNLMFNWPPKTALGDAIKATLSAAFSGYTVKVQISDQLKSPANYQGAGTYQTYDQFATMIKNMTNSSQYSGITTIDKSPYSGVNMTVRGKTIYVYDNSTQGANGPDSPDGATEIKFNDLVGQPTWVGPNELNFRTIMRGDILVGDFVRLPSTIVTPYAITTQGAAYPGQASQRNRLTFQGTFQVREIHHFGNFRQPDGSAWTTTFDAIVPPKAPSDTGTSNTPVSSNGPLSGGGV